MSIAITEPDVEQDQDVEAIAELEDNPFQVHMNEDEPDETTVEQDKPHAKFGWCQTHHHGYTFGVETPAGLCPGVTVASKGYPSLNCGCDCHRGIEPERRATPHTEMANAVDLVDQLDDGEEIEDGDQQ